MMGCMASILERSGLVLVDKPAGMTSHDVIARLRRIMGTRRVGHSGALDPMATGVLVVGIERGTKFLAHVVTHDKRYRATVRLGAATVTDDAEGDILSTASTKNLSEQQVRDALAAQVGSIMQRPSSVSSIKIDGKRAHERVRAGEDLVLPERPVSVFSLKVVDYSDAELDSIDVTIDVHCSSGTYIRSIARDVGEQLGVGGHLVALRRTSVGPFTIEQCATLEQLQEIEDPVEKLALTLDQAMVTCFPTREISTSQGKDLSLGKWLEPVGRSEVYAAVTEDGQAIALIQEKGKRAASVFVARPDGMN